VKGEEGEKEQGVACTVVRKVNSSMEKGHSKKGGRLHPEGGRGGREE